MSARSIGERRIIGRVRRGLVRFWTAPVRPEPLALMRICSAVSILISALLTIGPKLSMYWFPNGLIPVEVSQKYLERYDRFSVLSWVETPEGITALFWLWMASLVFVALGCLTRISCVIAWLLTVSFNLSALWVLNGGDDVAVQLLFYLMIAPSGAAWSIDARWKSRAARRRGEAGSETAKPIPPWSVRLIQIQLVIVYLLGGVNKLGLDTTNDYLTGEALYWVMNDITLTRWSYNSLPVPMIACRLLSWATIAFEVGFVYMVLVPRLRRWAIVGGLLLHAGILIAMDINWFSQNTVCFYPILLSRIGPSGRETVSP